MTTTIVIRCPQLAQFDPVNGTKSIYFLYKGTTPFDACVYPYMPLVGVEDLPVPTALLNRRSAVASMAAVDVVVPGYIQKFVLANQGGANIACYNYPRLIRFKHNRKVIRKDNLSFYIKIYGSPILISIII